MRAGAATPAKLFGALRVFAAAGRRTGLYFCLAMTFWLVLLFTFFFVRYLLPVVLRALLGGFVRKTMRNGGFGPQAGPGFGPAGPAKHAATPPGEVRVAYVPPAAPKPANHAPGHFKGGEYVEFEELP